MQQLFESWRKYLLSEAMKGPEDLPDGIYIGIRHRDSGTTEVYYSDYQGRMRRGEVWGLVRFGHRIGHGQSDCLGAWSVIISQAGRGWGPLLYDVAIELAGTDGLMADRESLSLKAYNVWLYYMNSRDDVVKKQLDDPNNTLTRNYEDNCETDSAEERDGAEMGEEELINSPVMKVYTKGPTTIEKLQNMGKLLDRREKK